MFLPGCETPNAAPQRGELQGLRQPFDTFGCIGGGCCTSESAAALPGAPAGSQSGPEPSTRGPHPARPESAAQAAAHSPPLLPHRPGRGLTSRFGNQRSLVPRLVLGAFPCRSWSSRWRTGPTT